MIDFQFSDIRLFAHISFAIIIMCNDSSVQQNVRSISLHAENNKPFIVIDQRKHFSTSILSAALTSLYGKRLLQMWKPTILLVVGDKIVVTDLEETIHDVSITFDSQLYLINVSQESNSDCDEISVGMPQIWEMYRLKTKTMISPVKLNQLPVYLEACTSRRRNFHLERLTASVKDTPDFNRDWGEVKQNEMDGSYYLAQGYIAVIYRELKLLLNFSESIVIGDSPVVNKNGTLTGKTLDQLNNDEADFTLNKLSLNPGRASGLTFLHPTHRSL